jgi:HAD superfamily hydrolase (TIGR01509 family)
MPPPAACLFDLDGLLLDTEPLHSQAWSEASRHFGLELGPEQLLALRGRRRLDCAEQVRQWMALDARNVPSIEQLLAVRQPIAEALLPQAPPMPGAINLIEACQTRGIPMALVTSSSRAAVALKEAPHPWLAAIALRVHGDDPELAAGKPAPDPYLLAAGRLQVEASACWAFEDSPAGANAATAAGCRVYVLLPSDGCDSVVVSQQLPLSCVRLQSLDQVVLG